MPLIDKRKVLELVMQPNCPTLEEFTREATTLGVVDIVLPGQCASASLNLSGTRLFVQLSGSFVTGVEFG